MVDTNNKFKVLVASSTFETELDAMEKLINAGFNVICVPISERKKWEEADFIREIKDVDALIVGGEYEITEKIISSANKLKVISLNCTGCNHVNIEAATKKGIIVCNAPGLSFNAVADFIMGQILVVMRNIVKGDRAIRSGQWTKGVERSYSVSGKTIGILGLGSIGLAVAKRAKGFDMKIVANARHPKQELEIEYGFKYINKEQLIKNSDIIVICCPLSEETFHLISEKEFNMMKKTAFLINSSRGPIIDEADLYEALKNRKIAGAALDVFSEEPLFESKLFELDNVVLTPHIAGLADKQILDVAVKAAENLVLILQGERSNCIINPEVVNIDKS